MRTYVYVDGFNLYYGALRKTKYKWLDLNAMCEALLKGNQIIRIKYFTAKIIPRPGDPQQATRQQFYIRALQTLPMVEIYYGHFLSHPSTMPEADANGKPNGRFVKVIKTEEKGSDVNISSHLLTDAFDNVFDTAAVVSNDSDLVTPIGMVRGRFNKRVGIINPHKKPSLALKQQADFIRKVREGVLQSSQFPQTLTDAQGSFSKPQAW